MSVDLADDDVLAQPTRARLFSLLSDLRHATSTGDLAKRLGRHPNGIRLHLERLREAGLVMSTTESGSRGRPRVLWAVDPDAAPGGRRPTAYADLSTWLTDAIADGLVAPEQIESKGREIGAGLAEGGSGTADAPGRLQHAFAAMGFQPKLSRGPGDGATYCLGNCPFREAAKESKTVVCGLHRGITEGFLSAVNPGARLTGFEARDPDAAGCRVDVLFDSAAPA
jgi:predicted ArsR family transcriptional regulator